MSFYCFRLIVRTACRQIFWPSCYICNILHMQKYLFDVLQTTQGSSRTAQPSVSNLLEGCLLTKTSGACRRRHASTAVSGYCKCEISQSMAELPSVRISQRKIGKIMCCEQTVERRSASFRTRMLVDKVRLSAHFHLNRQRPWPSFSRSKIRSIPLESSHVIIS